MHVEDPGAFAVPWNGRLLYQRVEPGRAERVFPPGVNSGATEAGPLLEKVVPKTRFPISETTAHRFCAPTGPISDSHPPDITGRDWVYVIWWRAMASAMIRSLIAR